jgi:hypothetical protein
MAGTNGTKLEVACFARMDGRGQTIVRGTTEQLSRKWLVVVLPADWNTSRLRAAMRLTVGVELPHTGVVGPRVMEFAATVARVIRVKAGLRIIADVRGVKIIESGRSAAVRGNMRQYS